MTKGNTLYFIAVVPPEPLRSSISRFKERLSQEYKTMAALKSPPHITIIPPFSMNSDDEPFLLDTVENIAKENLPGQPLFIKIDGLGAFPPRVIYLQVVIEDELIQLQKKCLTQFQKNSGINIEHYPHRKFTPHITLAFRDLKPKTFHMAWEKYKDFPVQYVFPLEAVYLLKHNGKTGWDLYQKFTK
ncbi:MAG: 2'-5' RNA ligase family protein [Cyclobacteriaceae bacterium]|nr:2'-5' RNA ligase family protein [Cyclobacteriaceae bacterium]